MPRPRNKNPRQPYTFSFQLDLGKPYERRLAEMLAEEKHSGKMTKTIREALMLYSSLQNSSVETLMEFFPRTPRQIAEYLTPEYQRQMRERREYIANLMEDGFDE